jgi:hypothetical protein
MASMIIARLEFGVFVLDSSIHAGGGWDGFNMLTSMERYCAAPNSWSEVSDVNTERDSLAAFVMRREMAFFDSLTEKAKQDR